MESVQKERTKHKPHRMQQMIHALVQNLATPETQHQSFADHYLSFQQECKPQVHFLALLHCMTEMNTNNAAVKQENSLRARSNCERLLNSLK